jgi:hypothetical protein
MPTAAFCWRGGVAATHGWAGSLIFLFVKSFNLVYLFVGYFCAIFLLYPMCQTISGGCKSGGFRMDQIQGFLFILNPMVYKMLAVFI